MSLDCSQIRLNTGNGNNQIQQATTSMCKYFVVIKEANELDKDSDDVQFVGSRNFQDRCSQLAKVTDQLYNKKNFPSDQPPAVTDLTGFHPGRFLNSRLTTTSLGGPSPSIGANNVLTMSSYSRRSVPSYKYEQGLL